MKSRTIVVDQVELRRNFTFRITRKYDVLAVGRHVGIADQAVGKTEELARIGAVFLRYI